MEAAAGRDERAGGRAVSDAEPLSDEEIAVIRARWPQPEVGEPPGIHALDALTGAPIRRLLATVDTLRRERDAWRANHESVVIAKRGAQLANRRLADRVKAAEGAVVDAEAQFRAALRPLVQLVQVEYGDDRPLDEIALVHADGVSDEELAALRAIGAAYEKAPPPPRG